MRKNRLLVGAGLLMCSASALAFPWDIDMVDAYFYRAYEWAMMPLPAETVSTNRYYVNGNRYMPEGKAMQNPLTSDKATLETGKRMFEVYCQTCHGVDGTGGAPVTANDPANGQRRYPIPPPMLSGSGNVSSRSTDGYLYLTISNGGAVMPAYGHSMDDHEMWSIVSYIRTLDGAQAPAAQ